MNARKTTNRWAWWFLKLFLIQQLIIYLISWIFKIEKTNITTHFWDDMIFKNKMDECEKTKSHPPQNPKMPSLRSLKNRKMWWGVFKKSSRLLWPEMTKITLEPIFWKVIFFVQPKNLCPSCHFTTKRPKNYAKRGPKFSK